ncbi:MAG TPA: ATP-binding protein [Acidimicrobiales bacterium]|nr:ATP-binding protein [Acidimicrobiales bacterium]
MENFNWSEVGSFRDREAERARLEQWWEGPDRQPINFFGRRRTGKSWLFRRVAHGKPSILLVARRSAPGRQLSEFASQLEPVLGVRPEIPDVPSLFRVLLRAARSEKMLAVIDEFPYLLPRGKVAADRVLSAVAAVIEEERGTSQLKLIVCGSTVATMEALQSERNPLHGRFTSLTVRPLTFAQARLFMSGLGAVESFERFAIAGGMPRYLSLLGGGPVRRAVCSEILDRNAPLFDEVRSALGQELAQSGQHFSILEQLATGDKVIGDIADALRQTSAELTPYLGLLVNLGLVERRLPLGAPTSSRLGHWHLTDPFFAFWFRFVFPFQDDLESGLDAQDLFDAEVAPALGEHVSRSFEDWARVWVRANFGRQAPAISSWWGNAVNEHRRTGERSSEEIDIVGISRSRVTLVGEAKWTGKPMPAEVLDAFERYKIPALKQSGFKLSADPTIVLLSKSGYSAILRKRAASDPKLVLVDVPEELAKDPPLDQPCV